MYKHSLLTVVVFKVLYSFTQRRSCAWFKIVLFMWCFVALPNLAMASRGVVKLDTPVAYCLTDLQHCNPTSQLAMQGKNATDFKALAGNSHSPVSLVFDIPKQAAPVAGGP